MLVYQWTFSYLRDTLTLVCQVCSLARMAKLTWKAV